MAAFKCVFKISHLRLFFKEVVVFIVFSGDIRLSSCSESISPFISVRLRTSESRDMFLQRIKTRNPIYDPQDKEIKTELTVARICHVTETGKMFSKPLSIASAVLHTKKPRGRFQAFHFQSEQEWESKKYDLYSFSFERSTCENLDFIVQLSEDQKLQL